MKNMNYFNNQPKSNDSQVKTSVDVGFQRSRASSNLGHTQDPSFVLYVQQYFLVAPEGSHIITFESQSG